jgi:hypothetical protein
VAEGNFAVSDSTNSQTYGLIEHDTIILGRDSTGMLF